MRTFPSLLGPPSADSQDPRGALFVTLCAAVIKYPLKKKQEKTQWLLNCQQDKNKTRTPHLHEYRKVTISEFKKKKSIFRAL